MVLGGRTHTASGIPITAISQKCAGPFPLLGLSSAFLGLLIMLVSSSSLSIGKSRKDENPTGGGWEPYWGGWERYRGKK